MVLMWSFRGRQTLPPCPRISESESAVSQDPQVMHVHIKIEEAVVLKTASSWNVDVSF